MMNDAIRIENLHVKYRGKDGKEVHAVRGLNFAVERGEVVGFLGPNGAGKSSTLKALMGFVTPSQGTAEVFGAQAGSPEAKKNCGYLPEVAMYYPFLTPLETLDLYGKLQGLRGKPLLEESKHLLEVVGLKDAMKKRNRTLSKGMLQRVGIAQSLLGAPELLVLDEVTSGLDPIGRQELRHLLKDRQRQGCTLFFSSHELSEVEMLCDRIIVIHQGGIIEEEQIDVLQDSLRQYKLAYTGTVNLLDLTESWSETADQSFSARFLSKEALIEAISRVNTAGGKVLDVVAQDGSLEDYFVETIRSAA